MVHLKLPLVISYLSFTFFLTHMYNYVAAVKGPHRAFHAFLSIFVYFFIFVGVGSLVYIGSRTAWYVASILFVGGSLLPRILAKLLPAKWDRVLSLLGFIAVPASAFFIFITAR